MRRDFFVKLECLKSTKVLLGQTHNLQVPIYSIGTVKYSMHNALCKYFVQAQYLTASHNTSCIEY